VAVAVVAIIVLAIILRPTPGTGGELPPALGNPQEWSTYLGSDARTSATTAETWLTAASAAQLGVSWSYGTGGPIASSVTVLGGTAYFGSWDGYEYAVNATTGRIVWQTFLGLDTYDTPCGPIGITSSATVGDGDLYVGGNNATGGVNATWYALNASSGQILWGVPIGNMSQGYYNWASPLVYNGSAYVGVASECDEPLVPAGLMQINLTTHQVQNFFHTTPFDTNTGRYELGASIWSSPSLDVATNTVFAATGNPPDNQSIASQPYSDAVLAFNATNITRTLSGQPGIAGVWQIPAAQSRVDGDFGAEPMVLKAAGVGGEDLVVAANKDGYVYGLNASNLGSWTVGPGQLGTLWQLNVSTTQDEIITPTAFGGGLVYFATPAVDWAGVAHPGSVWAVMPRTGSVVWNASLGGEAYGAPLYANGVLVVTAGTGFYAFNASSGQLLQQWSFPKPFDSAVSIAEGRLFEGDTNHYVYAICVPSTTCGVTAPL
jgi:outer membrane protein assembly factor BamB